MRRPASHVLPGAIFTAVPMGFRDSLSPESVFRNCKVHSGPEASLAGPARPGTLPARRLWRTHGPDVRTQRTAPTPQWHRLEPGLQPTAGPGRPTTLDLREIVNALLYRKQAGCAWRWLPHDFPN